MADRPPTNINLFNHSKTNLEGPTSAIQTIFGDRNRIVNVDLRVPGTFTPSEIGRVINRVTVLGHSETLVQRPAAKVVTSNNPDFINSADKREHVNSPVPMSHNMTTSADRTPVSQNSRFQLITYTSPKYQYSDSSLGPYCNVRTREDDLDIIEGWRDAQNQPNPVLNLVGAVGTGKTSLCRTVTRSLIGRKEGDQPLLAGNFFFRQVYESDSNPGDTIATMMISLAHSLSLILPEYGENVEKVLEETNDAMNDPATLWYILMGNALQTAIARSGWTHRSLFVIDGLDKCKPADIGVFFQLLEEFVQSCGYILWLLSYRSVSYVYGVVFNYKRILHIHYLEDNPYAERGIQLYIEHALDPTIKRLQDTHRDTQSLLGVKKRLEHTANGQFQYVALGVAYVTNPLGEPSRQASQLLLPATEADAFRILDKTYHGILHAAFHSPTLHPRILQQLLFFLIRIDQSATSGDIALFWSVSIDQLVAAVRSLLAVLRTVPRSIESPNSVLSFLSSFIHFVLSPDRGQKYLTSQITGYRRPFLVYDACVISLGLTKNQNIDELGHRSPALCLAWMALAPDVEKEKESEIARILLYMDFERWLRCLPLQDWRPRFPRVDHAFWTTYDAFRLWLQQDGRHVGLNNIFK
ncbi:hypothetical protein AX16_006261 [Volvariella volvacea WC 439]|nr:hypothetical protein AX16_006261 [Volvariella volvacea WC 439]